MLEPARTQAPAVDAAAGELGAQTSGVVDAAGEDGVGDAGALQPGSGGLARGGVVVDADEQGAIALVARGPRRAAVRQRRPR